MATKRVSIGAPRRGRVLVVDDDPLIVTAVRRSLAAEHDVVTTTSAREALDRVAAGEAFDVILCDLMMPVMTGFELYDELSRRAPEQAKRMVFLTGGAFTPRAREFLDRVENRRIDKPFQIGTIRKMVNEQLE